MRLGCDKTAWRWKHDRERGDIQLEGHNGVENWRDREQIRDASELTCVRGRRSLLFQKRRERRDSERGRERTEVLVRIDGV